MWFFMISVYNFTECYTWQVKFSLVNCNWYMYQFSVWNFWMFLNVVFYETCLCCIVFSLSYCTLKFMILISVLKRVEWLRKLVFMKRAYLWNLKSKKKCRKGILWNLQTAYWCVIEHEKKTFFCVRTLKKTYFSKIVLSIKTFKFTF